MTPFTLTLDAVKTAAREAYAKGELGFQKGEQSCKYKGDHTGAPCAVGAALPQELRDTLARDAWLNGRGVGGLVREGFIACPSDLQERAIAAIQRSHDSVIHAQEALRKNRGGHPDEVQMAIRRFELAIAE